MFNKIYISQRGEDFNILSQIVFYMFLTEILKAANPESSYDLNLSCLCH